MLYTTITIGGNEYKARLTAKACVDLEKKLGTNPLNVFMDIATKDVPVLPKLETIITILHVSLQAFQHGITIDKTYELYDKFIDEGHALTDLIPIIIEIFQVSGFLPSDEEVEETTEKNV